METPGQVFLASWGLTYLAVYAVVSLAIATFLTLTLITNSSFVLILVLFLSFGVCLIPMGFGATTLLSNVRVGGPLTSFGILLMALPFMLVVSAETDGTVSTAVLWWASLCPPLAFCLGMDCVWTFDGGWASQEGMHFGNMATPGPAGLSFAHAILMLWLDTLLWSALALYLECVMPQEIGATKPPHFLCLPSWWRHTLRAKTYGAAGQEISEPLLESAPCDDDDCAREAQDSSHGEVVLRLHKVVKVFRKRMFRVSPDDVRALDGVTLELGTGQIFGLLGHNGAGKTTLMNICCGLLEQSAGSAWVNGFDIRENMEAIRQSLGVCPQHDVLFDSLTLREHVRLFAGLKGVPSSDIDHQAQLWVARVGLLEKIDVMASTLSGGQKRRLSVALALVGEPRIVVLDEPTTGMDPMARRQLWEVLKAARALGSDRSSGTKKQGRLILLSTHYMDEADLLADRKAIIAHGKLRCEGSSLFLKTHFGLGYTLELSKAEATATVAPVITLVKDHVPGATLKLESKNEIHVLLPLDAVSSFGAMLTRLDSQMDSLQLHSYGITAGTLEDVFMRFAESAGTDFGGSTEMSVAADRQAADTEALHIDVGEGQQEPGGAPEESGSAWVKTMFWAMVHTKVMITRRNPRAFFFALLLPLLMIYINTVVAPSSSLDPKPRLFLCTQNLGGSASTELPIAIAPGANVEFTVLQGWLQQAAPELQIVCWDGSNKCLPRYNTTAGVLAAIQASFLGDSRTARQRRERWRGVILFERTDAQFDNNGWKYTVLYNMRETNAVPSYVATVNSAILAAAASNSSSNSGLVGVAATHVSLLPYPGKNDKQAPPFRSGGVFLAMAFAMPATTLVAYIVRDRELRTRHQLSVMGMPSLVYWAANCVFDSLLYSVTGFGSVVVLVATDTQPLGGAAWGPYTLLVTLFVIAMTLFSYTLSFLFKTHTLVYQVIPLLLQLSSIAVFVAVSVLQITDHNTAKIVNLVCSLLLPQYTILGATTYMDLQYYQSKLLSAPPPTASAYLGNTQYQQAIICYVIVIPCYLFLLVGLDRWTHMSCGSRSMPASTDTDAGHDVDADVLAEARRARAADLSGGGGHQHAICTQQLHKTFPLHAGGRCASRLRPEEATAAQGQPSEKVAVRNMSLTVSEGECLGLLGCVCLPSTMATKPAVSAISRTRGQGLSRCAVCVPGRCCVGRMELAKRP
jgi:ABC-type multidrug transport system ATPase subunit